MAVVRIAGVGIVIVGIMGVRMSELRYVPVTYCTSTSYVQGQQLIVNTFNELTRAAQLQVRQGLLGCQMKPPLKCH